MPDRPQTPAEFALIEKISRLFPPQPGVTGIGDDAAIIPPLQQPTLATDTLVAGRHFLADTDAADIGYKALAVNLSDLAAMGAAPRYALLNLTLPEADEAWVERMMTGFVELARKYDVQLIGGDTTAGPLSLTVTVIGEGAEKPISRDGAEPGDAVLVSGVPGRAAHGLDLLQDGGASDSAHLQILLRPEPRIELGRCLAGRVSAGLDISDGLLGDLQHLLDAGEPLGAQIFSDQLPLDDGLQQLPQDERLQYQLRGGDDYELLVTVPEGEVEALLADLHGELPGLSVIGRITDQPGIELLDADGRQLAIPDAGFEHF